MYGTVARVRVQPGMDEAFLRVSEEWTGLRGAATGQVAEYIFKLDGRPGEYISVGIFQDRATYEANARDPETDVWYRKMRALLVADPEWNDGEVVQTAMQVGI